MWSFAAIYILEELTLSKAIGNSQAQLSSKAGIFTSFLLYPVFGWLADARYGRYRVVQFSLLGLWASFIVHGLVQALLQLLHALGRLESVAEKQWIVGAVWYTLSALSGVGLGGLLANVAQLGIDQLQDNSSTEIASFLRWTGAVWLATLSLVQLVHHYSFCFSEIVNALVISALLSSLLCSDLFCSSWLVKEAGTSSAVATIVKVMRFVVKNKYPRLRSTYSYWPRGICSRIDVAKTKCGGPFTETQVEDTKFFLRVLPFIALASLVTAMAVHCQNDIVKMKYNFKFFLEGGKECGVNFMFSFLVDVSGTTFVCISVLLLELLPCSRVRRCIDATPTLKRAGVGLVLFSLSMLSCAVLEGVGTRVNSNDIYINSTCVFDLSEYHRDRVLSLSYFWTVIPNILWAFALYIETVTLIEFHCAQTPYSMKGMMFGLYFGFLGVLYAFIAGLLVAFKTGVRSLKIISLMGCGTFYFSSLLVMLVLVTVTFWSSYKCYKPRERNYSDALQRVGHNSYRDLGYKASGWNTY